MNQLPEGVWEIPDVASTVRTALRCLEPIPNACPFKRLSYLTRALSVAAKSYDTGSSRIAPLEARDKLDVVVAFAKHRENYQLARLSELAKALPELAPFVSPPTVASKTAQLHHML